MKYTNELIINASLEDFIKKMDDPENMKHWQRGFASYEFVDGPPGEKGSTMLMKYSKPKMELLETIINRDLPHEFHATYSSKGMVMDNKNYFSETPEGKTKWVSESKAETSNLFYKTLMFLFPGMFKKQTVTMMNDLKAFVENGTSVASQEV